MATETLGQRLARLRLGAGLTQTQLADVAGVSLQSLRNWENDRREPGWRAVVRLAKVLGVTAEDLADTVPVEEVGRVPRPAGPSRRPSSAPPPQPEPTGEDPAAPPEVKKRRRKK